ncbi:MAG TPA: hypothetical protein VMS45_09960, partial [Gemmatimonadaceae bacterium]|nr:hypothetical protein [Gemmatimonadaceae bacterium]
MSGRGIALPGFGGFGFVDPVRAAGVSAAPGPPAAAGSRVGAAPAALGSCAGAELEAAFGVTTESFVAELAGWTGGFDPLFGAAAITDAASAIRTSAKIGSA